MFDFSKYLAIFHTTFNHPSNGPMIPTVKRSIQYDTSNLIEIRGAYKRYTHIVLRGLNMTIRKGTIYGLLGPSGCGKTTLLKCITGMTSLDDGTIIVRCSKRNQLGFMPQETSLMEQFKVSELFHYFGRVHGLDTKTVMNRGQELLQLVNLPPAHFYHLPVTSLSGGQLRRVSLLVALIHNPELIILDEPTVGLDPITRVSLWEYFIRATVEQNKTIIITTHYIEEAIQSHKIGLMREGILIAEASPTQLLSDYKCSTLEEVFLQLSENQSKSSKFEGKHYPKTKRPPEPFARKNSIFNTNRLVAQITKNFCWVKRNVWMVVYMLLLPGLMSFLFCNVYNDDLKGLHIASVSGESCTHYSNVGTKCSNESRINCLYLHHMKNRGYKIKEYSDLSSGMYAITHGKSIALLHFNQNYTWALMDLMWSSVSSPPTNETLELSELQVTLDMTEMLKAEHVKRDIHDIYLDIRKEILVDCNLNPLTATEPIQIAEPIYGHLKPMFVHSALPGFIIPFVFYLTTTYISTAAATEKKSGVLQRSLVSGLTMPEVALAHFVMQLMIVFGQNCIILLIMYVIYENPMKGSLALALAFITISELQGMLYGFLLATIIKQEAFLTFTEIGTILALFLTSGMFWPIEGMVPALREIVGFSPWATASEAYRSISLRGWDLQHPSVFSALTYNIATAIVLVAANLISEMTNKNY